MKKRAQTRLNAVKSVIIAAILVGVLVVAHSLRGTMALLSDQVSGQAEFGARSWGRPSLEFHPDEWESTFSTTEAIIEGSLCNTGDAGGDVASDAALSYEATQNADLVRSIAFQGDFASLPGGECRALAVAVTLADAWLSQPAEIEVKIWLFAVPVNRPDHVTQVRLSLIRGP